MSLSFDRQFGIIAQSILEDGVNSPDRTGTGTRKVFSRGVRLDCSQGQLNALRIRSVAPRIAFEELLWMLRGDSNVETLQKKNIKIWDGNSSEDYLKRIGKSHIEAGTIGKSYPYQFRNFNGVDQLKEVVHGIMTNPYGRRHLISLWNPSDFKDMALEPCHYSYNFMVSGNKINLHQQLRSWDFVLGSPYNVMFATFFLGLVARLTGFEVGEVVSHGVDVHIYNNHLDAVETMLYWEDKADVLPTPTWECTRELRTLDDLLSLEWDDIIINDYSYILKFSRDDLPMAAG